VLLNILIGKAGLFDTVPIIGQPVSAVLRQVESIVDVSGPFSFSSPQLLQTSDIYKTLAFTLIDDVESHAADIQEQAQSLDGTLTTCINAYSGIQTKRSLVRSAKFARRAEVAAAA
jgi:hypothetical protein